MLHQKDTTKGGRTYIININELSQSIWRLYCIMLPASKSTLLSHNFKFRDATGNFLTEIQIRLTGKITQFLHAQHMSLQQIKQSRQSKKWKSIFIFQTYFYIKIGHLIKNLQILTIILSNKVFFFEKVK